MQFLAVEIELEYQFCVQLVKVNKLELLALLVQLIWGEEKMNLISVKPEKLNLAL